MGRPRRLNNATAAASCLELRSLHGGPGSVNSAGASVAGSACSYPPDNRDADDDDAVLDDFERRLDALFEKRGTTRERALEALAVMLRVDVRDADCQQHSETIISRCLMALKRGSAMESSLASQLLGLHVLTLGQPDDSLFESLRPELERTASGANGGGGAVAAAAMDALVLAAFVLCEDELAGTRPVMDRLRALWKKGDPKARAAAVRGWSFLLTSLDSELCESEAAACLAALAGLLEERDMELRTAAGEAVGVLRACCSARVLEALEEGEEEEEDGEEEGEKDGYGEEVDQQHMDAPAGVEEHGHAAANGNANGKVNGGGAKVRKKQPHTQHQHQQVEGLLGRMQELASNKGEKLRLSRRDRAAQRSTFRGLLASLSGGDTPSVRIKLQHGDCLELEGVAAVHRLAFLRRFLAGGFQAHLQHNALLHDVFGFQPRAERPDRLTALEKRLTRGSQSAGAKARSANRTWSRDAKASRMMMEAY